MKQKKAILLVLVFFLALTNSIGTTVIPARAEETGKAAEAGRYYYRQLTKEAKEFYEAMYRMYTEGIFKTGTGSYDLVSNGHVTQAQLAEYADGNTQLVNTMAAARDAFYADYPDIFYVDFSYLTLRVTRDASGKYHAYLGPGRGDNYYVKGFKNQEQVEQAVQTFDKKADELAAGARTLEIKEGENKIQQQVKYVHDMLIKNTSYHLEDTCQSENIGHIRTAYGALVKGESVCESYARAFKSVLDRLGIPCVLVQGIYRESEDIMELHMWTYVQIDGAWYAVDPTMDDPIVRDGTGGKENSYYFLVGQDIMSRKHIPNGEMSECGFAFTYPELAYNSLGLNDVAENGGLHVRYKKDGTFEEIKSGVFILDYEGMGYQKAAAHGKYMLMRFYTYNEDETKLISTEWGYMDPNVYGGGAFVDTDTELTLYVPHCLYVEFAVTDKKPRYLTAAQAKPEDLLYQGDPFLVEGATGMLYNPSGTYVAPPYIKKISPAVTGRIYMGQTYHVVAVYDDELVKSGNEEPHIEMESTGPTGAQYGKYSNFSFDGKSTVSFDFRPSDMWADESEFYYFHIKGLVGKKSGKIPNDISYHVSDPVASCSMKKAGIDWTLFAKPSLMESDDLSMSGWETSDGEAVSDLLKDRIALVVTSPGKKQSVEMMEMLKSECSQEDIKKSETYNLKLTVCKKQIVKTGDKIRISVGFPAGYGPEDAGTTFKAYHFMRDEAGNMTGVEEIPCIVTQYGLLLLCDSFSPFAVVAVKDDGKTNTVEKTVAIMHSTGGKISGADKIFTLQPGKEVQLQIAADEGYVIDEICVGSNVQEGAGRTTATINVKYSDLADGNSFVKVSFVAASVYQQEAARKEDPVMAPDSQPETPNTSETSDVPSVPGVPTAGQSTGIKPVAITVKGQIAVKEGGKLSIEPVTKEYGGTHTYQWYKDGVSIAGQTGKNLYIDHVAQSDAGDYTLVVTTSLGTDCVKAVSEACKVTVTENSGAAEQEQELSAVTGLKAASETAGSVKLEWKEVSGADGYEILRYDGTKKKYIIAAIVKNGVSYTEKGLTAGGAYRYKVRAYKSENGKKIRGTASAMGKILVKPDTPTKTSAVRLSDDTVQISFLSSKNASGYRIYRYTVKEKKFKLAYLIRSGKLYAYQAEQGKWRYMGRMKQTEEGFLACALSETVSADGGIQKYCIKAYVEKKGFHTQFSRTCRAVTVKDEE